MNFEREIIKWGSKKLMAYYHPDNTTTGANLDTAGKTEEFKQVVIARDRLLALLQADDAARCGKPAPTRASSASQPVSFNELWIDVMGESVADTVDRWLGIKRKRPARKSHSRRSSNV